MRIGDKQQGTNARTYSRASATPQDFGAGIATALQGLGGEISQYGEFLQQREKERKTNDAALGEARVRGEATRALVEMQQQAPRGAPDFTNQAHEMLRERSQEFLQTIDDDDLRQKYEARMESFIQSGATESFVFEYERGSIAYREDLAELTSAAQERVYADPTAFEEAYSELAENIVNSTLTQPEQEQLLQDTYLQLITTEYQKQIEDAQRGMIPVRAPDGSDVVAPGVSAPYRGLLNVVAGREAPDYQTVYGGGKFESYADHPRQAVRIESGPNAGQTSSAAGRYQFLASTWDFVVRSMKAEGYDFGEEEFSPVNQDRGAIWYANYRYAQGAKMRGFPPEMQNLQDVLMRGDRDELAAVRSVFSGIEDNEGRWQGVVWEGLQSMSDDAFATQLLGVAGAARGPTGNSELPDLWEDPRYADIPFEQRMQLEANGQKQLQEAREAEAQARREQAQALRDQLQRMADDGQEGVREAIDEALRRDLITDPKDRQALRDIHAADRAAEENARDVMRGVGAGRVFTLDDSDAVLDYFKKSQVLSGLREGDGDAAARLLSDVERIGVLPTEVLATLYAQLDSTNVNQSSYGAQTLAALWEQNPQEFARSATKEQVSDAILMSQALRYSQNPAEAVQRYRENNDPRTASVRAQLRDEARAELKDISPNDMLKGVTGFMERNVGPLVGMPSARLPAQAANSLRFQSEYGALYEEGYMRTGDRKQAKAYADEMMTYSWSTDPISGSLMEYSPSAAGTNVVPYGGDYSWIQQHVQTHYGFSPDTAVALQWDAQTRDDVVNGRTPTYTVTALLDDPVSDIEHLSIPTDERGMPLRVTMEPTEAHMAQINYSIQARNVSALVREGQQMEREGRLDPQAAENLRKLEGRLETLRTEGIEGGMQNVPLNAADRQDLSSELSTLMQIEPHLRTAEQQARMDEIYLRIEDAQE